MTGNVSYVCLKSYKLHVRGGVSIHHFLTVSVQATIIDHQSVMYVVNGYTVLESSAMFEIFVLLNVGFVQS